MGSVSLVGVPRITAFALNRFKSFWDWMKVNLCPTSSAASVTSSSSVESIRSPFCKKMLQVDIRKRNEKTLNNCNVTLRTCTWGVNKCWDYTPPRSTIRRRIWNTETKHEARRCSEDTKTFAFASAKNVTNMCLIQLARRKKSKIALLFETKTYKSNLRSTPMLLAKVPLSNSSIVNRKLWRHGSKIDANVQKQRSLSWDSKNLLAKNS